MSEALASITSGNPQIPEAEPKARPRKRITQLDGLRAIAILSVFLFHTLSVPFLWMGVDIFFVLSGFLITGVLLDRKAAGGPYFSYFYSRRARRILVPCALLMLISTILFGTEWVHEWYWYALFASNIPQIFHPGSPTSLGILWLSSSG